MEQIRSVSEAFLTAHKTRFLHRVEQGHVRDGHGDLRSDHIYLGHDGAIQIIDCIEFSDQLRQIDIVSDLAFLTMDLDHNACPQYADLVMQTYAKARNDPTGLMLWPFYQCYRAMVRCKVNAIHFQQANGDRHREAIHREAARQYLQQAADDAARMSTPVLIAMCGLPGAGKSTLARALARVQAIPVYRADVERIKRFGRSAGEGGVPATRRGRYSTPARNQVYHDLRKHARIALEEGRSVILDATFSRSIHRRAVRRLAATCGADMAIVMCRASAASTQTRLRQRETSPGLSDARRVHLPAIQKQFEPPAPGSDVIEIDTDGSIESALAEVLIRITRRPPPNLRPGALSALKGGHHVQNHLSGHGPGDRTRHDRYGGSDAERPLPV